MNIDSPFPTFILDGAVRRAPGAAEPQTLTLRRVHSPVHPSFEAPMSGSASVEPLPRRSELLHVAVLPAEAHVLTITF